MQFRTCLLCLIALGCGEQPAGTKARPAKAPQSAPADHRRERPKQPESAAAPAAVRAPGREELPPDLGTRKHGTDWPQFLGPLGTGVSPERGIISPWPKRGLKVVWDRKVGVGYGMPTISRGRLFQFDRHDGNARLTCLKSETGEFLWKFEYATDYEDYYNYNNGPRCSPVVDGNRVYIFGAEGMLHCVRAADGELVWKVDTKADFGVVQNFFGVGSTPVVEGELLIVQVGGSPPGSGQFPSQNQKGNGSGIVAFDKLTGKVRYKVTDELASYAGPVLATIHGRRWCFVFARGGLVGMNPADGKVDFHFPWRAKLLESVNASNPVVVGDRVFISECYGVGSALLKVKPGGYDVLWTDTDKRLTRKSLLCHWNTPIHHAGYLYGCSGRHTGDAELRCIELATGKVMWSNPEFTRTSLMMVDGHFVCLAEDGLLLLLKPNPNKYEEVSRMDLRAGESNRATAIDAPALKEPCWAAPILSHGLLYVRGADRLVCFESIPEKR